MLVQEAIAVQEHIEIKVVVRPLAGFSPQDTAFAAAIASTQEQALQCARGDDASHRGHHFIARVCQVRFQLITAIQREAFSRVRMRNNGERRWPDGSWRSRGLPCAGCNHPATFVSAHWGGLTSSVVPL